MLENYLMHKSSFWSLCHFSAQATRSHHCDSINVSQMETGKNHERKLRFGGDDLWPGGLSIKKHWQQNTNHQLITSPNFGRVVSGKELTHTPKQWLECRNVNRPFWKESSHRKNWKDWAFHLWWEWKKLDAKMGRTRCSEWTNEPPGMFYENATGWIHVRQIWINSAFNPMIESQIVTHV